MMSSTWKISVFGIVALMLSFGLVAGDALAHSDGQHAGHTRSTVKHDSAAAITVTATSQAGEDGTGGAVTRDEENLFADSTGAANMLRATEKLDALVFTYSHGGVPSKKGTVTLTIPRTWTRAQPDNANGEVEPGEVTVSGANSYTVRSAGGGWQVKANLTSDPPAGGYGPTVITYQKVTVPNRAGKYEFALSSTTVGDGHVSTVDPHSTVHAMGNDPNVDDDAIDTDPRAHSHSDDATNVGSITITVYEHSHIFDPAETAHEHGDNGNVKIIDGHRHTADKSHSHFDDSDRDDDGHVDTSEDDHDTHPEGMSSHKHNDAGTAIVEHSHTKSGKPLTVDKQDHEHATDAGGETREATAHTHDATGDASATVNGHTHDEDGITDVSGHSHMVGTKARDGDVLDHEHDAGEVIRVGTADGDITQHDHDGIDSGETGESDPEYDAPAAAVAHTHDKAPDGTVAKVPGHKHDGDPLGVKMNHEHGGDDGAVIVFGGTNLTQHDHDGIDSGDTGESDPEYDAPVDGQGHIHDRDLSVSDVAEHEHADADSKLADHEHGAATGTQPEDVTAHRHLRDGSVYDDGDPNTSLADVHTHDGANVRNVDIEHDHDATSQFPQRHAHEVAGPVNYDDLEDHASHSLNTFGRSPLTAWHHKHDTSRDNRGGLIKLNDDTEIGSAVIAHTHTSTNTGNIVMVTDHSHEVTDADLDGFSDIDIEVVQHTMPVRGLIQSKPSRRIPMPQMTLLA